MFFREAQLVILIENPVGYDIQGMNQVQIKPKAGITLVKKLKSQSSTRNIPIIMLTAESEVGSEVEVLGAGADDYLVKPVDPKRFLARVRKFLNPKSIH